MCFSLLSFSIFNVPSLSLIFRMLRCIFFEVVFTSNFITFNCPFTPDLLVFLMPSSYIFFYFDDNNFTFVSFILLTFVFHVFLSYIFVSFSLNAFILSLLYYLNSF